MLDNNKVDIWDLMDYKINSGIAIALTQLYEQLFVLLGFFAYTLLEPLAAVYTS